MEKIIKRIIAPMLTCVFLFGCSGGQTVKESKEKNAKINSLKSEDIKIDITAVNVELSENLINETRKKAQQAVLDVVKYFDFDTIDDYSVHVRENGIGYSSGNITMLNKWMLESNHALIVHELTHVLCNSNTSMSAGSKFFTEGIAVLMQEKYGDKAVEPFIDGSTKEFARVSVEDSIDLIKVNYTSLQQLIDNDGEFYEGLDKNLTAEKKIKRKNAYIQAGTFFIFLDKVYGREKIKKLYYSSEKLDFKGAFGKELDELEKEYIKYFNIK
ncbi:hypothetical protein SAMN05444401_2735 [Clostridium amylolyticum]|uniref:Peptidase n=1 Tax=Clostridium amylolyticum TaxID=1121298 RepID=A0A1M6IBR7_9CLOT|nr:hypothetical protein [Clostridium amylolyticum]SHJ31929.1 hypothetical protein SAMN05444401_2735 [Clostridium amylolyticum]